MGGEILLILGAIALFVLLAGKVVSWVLPASSLGEWTEEEKEKGKENPWWSIR